MNFDLTKLNLEQNAVAAASALAIFIIGWLLAGFAERLVRRASEKSGRLSPTLIPLFARFTRVALLVVVVLAALDKVGVDTSGLFAMIGAAGLAIGLALKDTVSDVAAGVILLVLRPFDVNEAVDIAGTGGSVTDIGLFQVKLTSFEGVPIVLNNTTVRRSIIQNYSRAATRRIDLEIGISYGADIGKAKSAIQAVLEADSRVLREPAILVNTLSLADSAVVILARCTTKAGDFWTTKLDLTRAIKERLDAEGISIPFPQRDVHLIRDSAA